MNRVLAANSALYALIEAAFAATENARLHRNPKGQKAWDSDTVAVVFTDDKDPETLRAFSGPLYDLSLQPEVMVARRGPDATRAAEEWDDVQTIKAALDADVTLGGIVEDARVEGVEGADLDDARWVGGGLTVRIRLLFNATTPAG